MDKYGDIKSIAVALRITAFVLAFIVCLAAVIKLFKFWFICGVIKMVLTLLGGAMGFLILLGVSEAIYVLLDVEGNTRRAAERLEKGGE